MKAFMTTLAMLMFSGIASANINVNGTGKIVYVPDIGYVRVGVHADGKTAAEAWEKNREIVARIFDALKKQGIDPKDMQTTNLNVSPKYIHRPGEEPDLVGYTVNYDLSVTVRRLPEMGLILDKMVESGANRNMNISFGIADPEKLLDEARAKAVTDARKKAKLMASAAGARLGKIVTISENSHLAVREIHWEHQLAAKADRPMDIAAGSQDMSVTVNVIWTLLEDDKAE